MWSGQAWPMFLTCTPEAGPIEMGHGCAPRCAPRRPARKRCRVRSAARRCWPPGGVVRRRRRRRRRRRSTRVGRDETSLPLWRTAAGLAAAAVGFQYWPRPFLNLENIVTPSRIRPAESPHLTGKTREPSQLLRKLPHPFIPSVLLQDRVHLKEVCQELRTQTHHIFAEHVRCASSCCVFSLRRGEFAEWAAERSCC